MLLHNYCVFQINVMCFKLMLCIIFVLYKSSMFVLLHCLHYCALNINKLSHKYEGAVPSPQMGGAGVKVEYV